ncbi:site-specific integrase [Pseudomonas tremae]|uniref:tyrosine-type recombinase/integrase n=1 Tax=Pseudomonas tremae TaxID=200454 RepID=UPI001F376D1B|nr:site-specific integrase [Pseudomonas tremae]MCF5711031.1 tyrosine-type recombinase/integrase [Pseudomonas tremae]UQB32217.1 site-specific integrase [Pseudomonas tremae]
MALSIRRFQSDTGERFAILVDEVGMPLYYPALYATAVLRGGSLSINTIINALGAIKMVCAWESYYAISMESRFKRSELLCAHEIHSLRDFMQKPMAETRNGGEKVVPIKGRRKPVSKQNHYNRLTVAAEYMGFIAGRLHPASASSASEVATMVSRIKASRPKMASKIEDDRSAVHLEDALLNLVEDVIAPGSEANPVREYGLQMRNALMFTLLRCTGMRRGELLNLKIEDFDFAMGTVKIVRRADSADDPRTYQPLAKTRERIFPLIPELMDKIRIYINKWRNKVPGARRHGYLFVTHRPGKSLGWPLSGSGFGKFMETLARIADGACKLHAHALRHHWNYVFSKRCEEQGLTPEAEENTRSYLMGWSETSGTAATYNKRHVKEAAAQAVISLQNKHLGRMANEPR